MTTQLTVRPSDASAATGVASATIASLPVSLAYAGPGATADIVEVDGGTGWAAKATQALHDGARAVIVTAPTDDDPAAISGLGDLIESLDRPVLLSEPFASNALLDTVRDDMSEKWADQESVFVFSTVNGASMQQELLGALRSLRALGATALTITDADVRDSSASLNGHATIGNNTMLLGITIARTSAVAPTVRLRSYGPGSTLEMELSDASTARPATAMFSDSHGATQWPTQFEDAHRTVWRFAVRAAADKAAASGSAVRAFAADVTTARDITG